MEKDLRVARGVVREVDRHFDASERLRLGKWIDPDERERTIAQHIVTAITTARAEQREVNAKIAETVHADKIFDVDSLLRTEIATAIRSGKE